MSEQAKELAREADAAWEAVYEVLGRETAARLQRAVRATAAVVVARAMDGE